MKNSKLLFIMLAVLFLVGCKQVVEATVVGEPRQENRLIDCTHSGFCYTCMPGMGQSGCRFKHSSFCPGTVNALVKVTTMRYVYDDGSVGTDEVTQVLSRNGVCQ